jgi:hypothetical protein
LTLSLQGAAWRAARKLSHAASSCQLRLIVPLRVTVPPFGPVKVAEELQVPPAHVVLP